MQKEELLLKILFFTFIFVIAIYNYYSFSKRIYHHEKGKDFDKSIIITFLILHTLILISFSTLVVYGLTYLKLN